jgi:hypothetical protein
MFWNKLLKNNPKSRFTWSILNAFVMLIITFSLLSTPYVLPDEFVLVRYSSIVKNILFELDEKSDTNRFLFINVAWDKKLAPKPDADIANHFVGNEAVTDRAKLVGLLQLLKKRPEYKFIVLDIFFKGKTPYDSTLTELINNLPNVLVSYHRTETDLPDRPDLKIKPLGLSDLEVTDDKAIKFKIFFNDSLKSTPLLMYENIHKKELNTKGLFYSLNHKLVFNSFILNYRIRNFHYRTKVYPKVHLGEWINNAYGIYPEDIPLENTSSSSDVDANTQAWLDSIEKAENKTKTTQKKEPQVDANTQAWLDSIEKAENKTKTTQKEPDIDASTQAWLDSIAKAEGEEINFQSPENTFDNPEPNWEGVYDLAYLDSAYTEAFIYPLLKDKIIFVGDFEDKDMHETIYGNTPGPIILLDAFLALEAGDNVIKVSFVIYLLFAFWLISYMNFYYEHVYNSWIKKITRSKKVNALEAFTVYTIYFMLVSIISFFLFNIHIGVLVLTFYMYVIDKVKDYIVKRMEKNASLEVES